MATSYLSVLIGLIVEAGGTATGTTCRRMMPDTHPALVRRGLKRAVDCGALVKRPMAGSASHECVWATSRVGSLSVDPDERPGMSYLGDSKMWIPGPTFAHDQMAAQCCGIFGKRYITEHELRRANGFGKAHLTRIADGLLVRDGKWWAVEVELSKKTGQHGGWAQLATAIIRRTRAFGRTSVPYEQESIYVTGTLLVTPKKWLEPILNRILDQLEGKQLAVDSLMWVDADDPEGNALVPTMLPGGPGNLWPGYREQQASRPRNAAMQDLRKLRKAPTQEEILAAFERWEATHK